MKSENTHTTGSGERTWRPKALAGAVLLAIAMIAGSWLVGQSPAAAQTVQQKRLKIARQHLGNDAVHREKILQAAEGTNLRLDKLIALLQSGKVEVIVISKDAGPQAKVGQNAGKQAK